MKAEMSTNRAHNALAPYDGLATRPVPLYGPYDLGRTLCFSLLAIMTVAYVMCLVFRAAVFVSLGSDGDSRGVG